MWGALTSPPLNKIIGQEKRRAQAFFCGENRIGFSGPYPPLAAGSRVARRGLTATPVPPIRR